MLVLLPWPPHPLRFPLPPFLPSSKPWEAEREGCLPSAGWLLSGFRGWKGRERPWCFCPAPSPLCISGSHPMSCSSLSFHWILVSPLLPLPFQTRLGTPSHRCQSLGATSPLLCLLSPAHTSGSTPWPNPELRTLTLLGGVMCQAVFLVLCVRWPTAAFPTWFTRPRPRKAKTFAQGRPARGRIKSGPRYLNSRLPST